MVVNVTPQRAWELMSRGEVDVVDVREPAEWEKGHVPGARLVPLAQVRANPTKHLPEASVLFICAGGVRSQTAARIAFDHGITPVYSVIGGTASWVKAGLPVTTPLDVAV
jgi:adenylyltransferase/sulfurtransferase